MKEREKRDCCCDDIYRELRQGANLTTLNFNGKLMFGAQQNLRFKHV